MRDKNLIHSMELEEIRKHDSGFYRGERTSRFMVSYQLQKGKTRFMVRRYMKQKNKVYTIILISKSSKLQSLKPVVIPFIQFPFTPF